MILREATIKYSGRDPDKLKSKSSYRICVSCDECGRIRWVRFYQYRSLCQSCAGKQEKILKICKICSKEFSVVQSQKHIKFCSRKCMGKQMAIDRLGENNPMFGMCGKDAPAWKGGLVTLICEWCGNEFRVNKAQKNIAKFCSEKCTGKWKSENLIGNLNPNWKGGINGNRDYVLSEQACIKLNERFNNSEFHHITKSVGIFIPHELHRHIWHNMKSGQGMGSMNLLALQFINGEL